MKIDNGCITDHIHYENNDKEGSEDREDREKTRRQRIFFLNHYVWKKIVTVSVDMIKVIESS